MFVKITTWVLLWTLGSTISFSVTFYQVLKWVDRWNAYNLVFRWNNESLFRPFCRLTFLLCMTIVCMSSVDGQWDVHEHTRAISQLHPYILTILLRDIIIANYGLLSSMFIYLLVVGENEAIGQCPSYRSTFLSYQGTICITMYKYFIAE